MNASRKVCSILVCFLLLASSTFALTPQLINYQGFVADNLGDPINGTLNLTFRIYEQESGGSPIWEEAHVGVTATEGGFSVQLGINTTLSGSFFDDTLLYLGVTVGIDAELTPRSRLVSTPYAYRVASVNNAEGGDIDGGLTLNSTSTRTPTYLIMNDENGDTRVVITIESEEATMDFHDPVDVKEYGDRALGRKAVSVKSSGIVVFGDSPADTNIFLDTAGNFIGKGKIVIGQNSSNPGSWSTVLGYNNMTDDLAHAGTISGGSDNTVLGRNGVVGGGWNNLADTSGAITISGGRYDTANGDAATIGGGKYNFVDGSGATIGGGTNNRAIGIAATVPGGSNNVAAANSTVAMGSHAKATHRGSIVIAANGTTDQSDSVNSGGIDQIVLRADGGIYITNTSEVAPYNDARPITTYLGAFLSGGGNWTNAPTVANKTNRQAVDGGDIVDAISKLTLYRWEDDSEGEPVTHISPLPEEFNRLLGVGSDDQSLSTLDPAGAALAAIQELIKQNAELQRRVERLEALLERRGSGR